MSEFNLIWRKYGLKENPYFNAPLTIDGGTLPLTSFIGREKEKQELKRVIEMGGEVRFMVTGEAGVGKTSLVNYVRHEASKQYFFTPIREIEINKVISANEFMIITICAIYDEAKRLNIPLANELTEKLNALYELARYEEELSYDITNSAQLNKYKLVELFRELVNQIINPRFNGIILHYDNLDNIEDLDKLSNLISEVRDFLLTKGVIFIFVGDNLLPLVIMDRMRVAQIFLSTHLEVKYFSYKEIKKILDERINRLRISKDIPLISPHTEEAISALFALYGGNIREILNGLASCVQLLPPSNTAIQINEDILKDILFKRVNEIYLSKLTPIEIEILYKILEMKSVTPTKLKEITGKTLQNISSKYLPKLMAIGAVRLRSMEGRKRYYEVTPTIKWLRFKRDEREKIETKEKIRKKINEVMQKSLGEFL